MDGEGTDQANRLEQHLRRRGLQGEAAFYAVAGAYAAGRRLDLPTVRERSEQPLARAQRDATVGAALDQQVAADPHGDALPVIYQHLVGSRFRQRSGKFFTPAPVAASMARLLPRTPGAMVLDPTCGGGTFLAEAASWWGDVTCTLAGNDVEPTLADLTRLRLALAAEGRDTEVTEENLYEADALAPRSGTVDAILANPPFSLPVAAAGVPGPLAEAGYATSDAVFLDVVHRLLRPGGRLVALLPHSLLTNKEHAPMRAITAPRWALRAAITLPEGIFHLTAGTATRAGIVVLDRRPCPDPDQVAYAHCATVGQALNARGLGAEGDDLADLVADPTVRRSLDLEGA